MPRGQVRSSFKLNQRKKTVVPTRDIWDVDKIKDMWADVGLTVHEVRPSPGGEGRRGALPCWRGEREGGERGRPFARQEWG